MYITRTCDNQNNFGKGNKLGKHSDLILRSTLMQGHQPGWGGKEMGDTGQRVHNCSYVQ